MTTPRLFVDVPLAEGLMFALPAAASNYLGAVMRLGTGDTVRLFDDQTGEWKATVASAGKRGVEVRVGVRLSVREAVPDVWLCAAPIKRQRIDWVAEKACELGVARLVPVLTRRTIVDRVNLARLRAHMIEAAEQCGRTALPVLVEPVALETLLAGWPAERALLFADETGGAAMPRALPPAAILIGPEGGFDADERAAIRAHPNATAIALGPRILRADTAAVAAIALWQARCGDWAE